MITFRRHHPDAAPPPWAQAPVCTEYHLSGLELRLIDLIDARERAVRGGFDDVEAIDAEIATIQDELVALSDRPAPPTVTSAA